MTPMPLLQVEMGGLLTTVQDAGRTGYQRDGLTPSGPMDPWALAVANLLCGNERGAAALEITLLGPNLRVLAPVRLALTGADLSATVDGLPLAVWQTHTLTPGQTLRFGRRRVGARAYLAVPGGLAVPQVLGSRSTFLRGGFGGVEGRRLQAGDILVGLPTYSAEPGVGLALPPVCTSPAVLRVLPGPHDACFSEAARTAFFEADYTVSLRADRQGFRLDGPPVPTLGSILSEAAPFGGVQVPPDGQPLLLMADRQPTGGYPLLGVVISSDLTLAGQLAPGDAVRFWPVTLAEAHRAAWAQERELRVLEYAAAGSAAQSGAGEH